MKKSVLRLIGWFAFIILLATVYTEVSAQELEDAVYPVEIQSTWAGDVCTMTENWNWEVNEDGEQSPTISYTIYKNNVGQFSSAANEFVLLNNCDDEYSITWTVGLEAIIRTGWNDSSWDEVLFSVEDTESISVINYIKDSISGSLVVVYGYVDSNGEYQSGNVVIPQIGEVSTVPYELENTNLIRYSNSQLLFSVQDGEIYELTLWETYNGVLLFEGTDEEFLKADPFSIYSHSESGNDIALNYFDYDGPNFAGWGSMNGSGIIEFFVYVIQPESPEVRAKRLQDSPRTVTRAIFRGNQFIVIDDSIVMIFRDSIQIVNIIDVVNSVDNEVDYIDVTIDYIGG